MEKKSDKVERSSIFASRKNSLETYSSLTTVCFYALFFGFCSLLFYPQAYNITTIGTHIKYAENLAKGIKALPHLGFFYFLWGFKAISGLSFQAAAVVLLSFFATLNAGAFHFVFKKLLPGFSTVELLILTGITMTVAAIYLPFFNKAVYFGQGSPNMWHNATVIAVKAVSVLGFFMMVNFLEKTELQNSWQYGGVISLILLLSVFIKPTFVIVLLPAVGIFILLKHPKEFKLYWTIAVIAIPAIILMLYQTTYFYAGLGQKGCRINQIAFLKVWRMFTPNVGISILITIAFPLAILAFRFKAVIQNQFLSLAWITMLIGLLQFALMAEYECNGKLIKSANWIGGYLIGLTLLFLFTMVEYARWRKEANSGNRKENIKVWLTSILLALHTFSGGYYICELIVYGKTKVIWQ